MVLGLDLMAVGRCADKNNPSSMTNAAHGCVALRCCQTADLPSSETRTTFTAVSSLDE